MTKLIMTLLCMSIVFVGCKPEQEATEFNIARFVSPLTNTSCSMEAPSNLTTNESDEYVEKCQLQAGCQAVLDEGNRYAGCMPIPLDPPKGDDTAADGGDDTSTPPADGGGGETMPPADDSGDDTSTPPADGGGEAMPPAEDGGSDTMPPVDDSGDDTSTPPADGGGSTMPPAADGDDAEEETPADHACSDPEKFNHKVLVCHKNNGKKGNVTICIAQRAWESAHVQNSHHEGQDYLGACTQSDLQE